MSEMHLPAGGKTPHQKRVEQFMELAGQDVPARPEVPEFKVRKLRAALILEEALETITGLGFSLVIHDKENVVQPVVEDKLELVPTGAGPDLIEIVDGCCDLSVVTIGTLSACGVKDKSVLEEIDASNLTKFGPGHSKRADGKLLKSPEWLPPKVSEILKQQK